MLELPDSNVRASTFTAEYTCKTANGTQNWVLDNEAHSVKFVKEPDQKTRTKMRVSRYWVS